MNIVLIALIIVVGVLNFLPLAGLFSAAVLERSYGIALPDPNTELLLRHRAILFGLVGGLVLASVIITPWRTVAMAIATVSMASFVVLVFWFDNNSPELLKIAYIDVAGVVLALFALALMFSQTSSQ